MAALPAFVEDTPNYEVRDGRMYISIGDLSFAMPIHVYLDACDLGRAAIVDWQRNQCGIDRKVVSIKR
jgi:hypothetical protein